MTKITHYEELRVWQEAMELARLVYPYCGQFPREEIYGLTSQLKRAAVSIPFNIAEGSARGGTKELIQFLYIAKGSLAEVRTQILLAERLELAKSSEEINALCRKLSIGLTNLISALRKP